MENNLGPNYHLSCNAPTPYQGEGQNHFRRKKGAPRVLLKELKQNPVDGKSALVSKTEAVGVLSLS